MAMFRGMILLSAFAAGMAVFGASGARAAALAVDAPPAAAGVGADGIQLAQYGDVEVYYDEFGRRIVRDAYTGEIIAIERPRRYERRQQRQVERNGGDERYYLDDPEDMRRLREQKRRDSGIAPRQPRYDYQDDYARGGDPGLYDDYPQDDYLEPPQRAFPDEPEPEYRQAAPQPAPRAIERRPLEAAPANPAPANPGLASPAPLGPPATADRPQGPVIAETPPAGGAVQPGGAVDSSLKLGGREDIAALQVLLDRRGASPGVVDGRFGSNVDKAIVAYRSITGENLRSTDTEGIRKALAASGGDAFTSYTITAQDAAGPFVASVPADYGEKAKLEKMSYTSTLELLAERFHMDEAYLKALNPEANFNRPGTIIRVANTGKPVATPVTRIVADKGRKMVFAYDADRKLVAAYPSTIGSTETPSPTGTHTVARVVLDPDYTYNPKVNFKQGDNDKVLTIPPGPNGPVGNVWIALSKPSYGIHGTPDPSKIGKTESKGCVRLTNWDAQELAKLVKPGVSVEFVE